MIHRLFDDNQSVWLLGKTAYQPAPALDRDLELDVAIVGGGFTGVSTAYHLSERSPELGIGLFEARQLANGASGRNGGQMLNWVHGVDDRDLEAARRVYDTTSDGIAGILEVIHKHGLDVPHRRDGHLDVLTNARNAESAQAEVEELNRAGIPLRYLDPREAREQIELEGIVGAVLDPGGGQLDGVAFIRALRPVLESRGVRIFESTPILRIREGRTVELEAERARVRAKAIVLGTNAYTPHLGYFRGGLFPLHSHVIALAGPEDDGAWAARGWKQSSAFTDDRGRLAYATLTVAGQLLFGGGSNDAYDYVFGNGTGLGPPPERAVRACHRQLLDYLPRTKGLPLARKWSGPVALTLSRLPTMGVRGVHRNVFFALGFSGHGVTLANLAGRVLTDLYSGDAERWRGLPFFEQRLRFIPPEPFRWMGYQVVTRLTGRSPRVRA